MSDTPESDLLKGPQCRMVYASLANPDAFTRPLAEELLAILEVSQRYNRDTYVGGLLMYVAGHFCQVLEGPCDAVEATYQRISSDPRHGHCKILLREPIERRRYPGLPMALVGVDDEMHPDIQGVVDHEGDLESNEAGQALIALLEARIDPSSLTVPMFLGKK